MEKTSRRNILKVGAALGAGMVSSVVLNNGNSEAVCPQKSCSNLQGHTNRWDHEYTWGHDKLFMEEYYDGTMEILGSLSGEIDQIGDLTDRAAGVIRNGGTVWQSMASAICLPPNRVKNAGGMPVLSKIMKLLMKDTSFSKRGICSLQATATKMSWLPVNAVFMWLA